MSLPLYPTKAYSLPAVCERYGLDPGGSDEAFSSKTRYLMRRLEKLSDEKVFGVAKSVVQDFPDDKLLVAIELLEKDGHLITDLTRHHLAEALDEFFHWPASVTSLRRNALSRERGPRYCNLVS